MGWAGSRLRGDLTGAARSARRPCGRMPCALRKRALKTSRDLLSELLRLPNDPTIGFACSVALALGETDDSRAMDALATIARRDGAESWMRAAILSSVKERSNEFLRAFVASPAVVDAVRAAVMQDLGQLFGAGPDARALPRLDSADYRSEWGVRLATCGAVGHCARIAGPGTGRTSRSALMALLLVRLSTGTSWPRREWRLFCRAPRPSRWTRRRQRISVWRRLDCWVRPTTQRREGRWRVLLAPQHPSEIQVAAVRALSQLSDRARRHGSRRPRSLAGVHAEVRETVLSALDERRAPRRWYCSTRWRRDRLPPRRWDPSRRNRLRNHRDAADSETRPSRSSPPWTPETGCSVYERLRGTVLARTGNSTGGKQIFATHCATCHSFDGAGRYGWGRT